MGKTGGSVRTLHTADSAMSHVRKRTTSQQQQQQPTDNQIIRLRLLNRLGIHQKKEPPISAAPEHHRRKHGMRKAAHFCLPLKDDDSDDDIMQPASPSSSYSSSPPPTSNSVPMSPYTMSLDGQMQQDQQEEMQEEQDNNLPSTSNNSSSPRRRIQFNSNVMVVPIPSRHAYSKRIKQAFWMDGAEIQATAERNRYEFASEGWDYQQVLEDEDMYMDVATGQLVHPCWVEDEDDEEEEGGSTVDQQTAEADDRPSCIRKEEEFFEVKTPCLKRTTSGIFELKDVEGVSSGEKTTKVDDAVESA